MLSIRALACLGIWEVEKGWAFCVAFRKVVSKRGSGSVSGAVDLHALSRPASFPGLFTVLPAGRRTLIPGAEAASLAWAWQLVREGVQFSSL